MTNISFVIAKFRAAAAWADVELFDVTFVVDRGKSEVLVLRNSRPVGAVSLLTLDVARDPVYAFASQVLPMLQKDGSMCTSFQQGARIEAAQEEHGDGTLRLFCDALVL